ncbi:uncharacterized protein EV422DRAFT_520247 [Fimicolochytrium jonesii]|uniref:uncharacterized protein n=1 Tax=Fimicolochytrium jonesii TaxID=1396493 RepID=UPI0022FF126E|nr:uncharacterized protein EV422DRAFT_520247 [Fimicolochytrium jonesii]KAI8824479.1 hypothetical protein EV422DRAFT_520247 [Fimicolochytrium jonesii]
MLVKSLPRASALHRQLPLFAVASTRVRFNTTFPQPKQAAESFNARRPIEVLITNDHRSFDELFERYHKTKGDKEAKQAIVNEFIREVAQHSIAEETAVYPLIDEVEGDKEGDHLRADHAEVKNHLFRLDKMSVGDAGFDDLFARVVAVLKSHAKEEETKHLPLLAKKMSEKERIDLSSKFLRRKAISPTRSHPNAPDKPASLELLAGLPVAPIDKLRDQTRKFAERRIPQQ